MYFIEKTPEFDKWLRKLKDLRAKAKFWSEYKNWSKTSILEIVNRLEMGFEN